MAAEKVTPSHHFMAKYAGTDLHAHVAKGSKLDTANGCLTEHPSDCLYRIHRCSGYDDGHSAFERAYHQKC